MAKQQTVLKIQGGYQVDAEQIIAKGGVVLQGGRFQVANDDVEIIGLDGRKWKPEVVAAANQAVVQTLAEGSIDPAMLAIIYQMMEPVANGGRFENEGPLQGHFRVDVPKEGLTYILRPEDEPGTYNYLLNGNSRSVDTRVAEVNRAEPEACHGFPPEKPMTSPLAEVIFGTPGKRASAAMTNIRGTLPRDWYHLLSAPEDSGSRYVWSDDGNQRNHHRGLDSGGLRLARSVPTPPSPQG